ncbi:hypothetical protein ACXIVK_36365 [Paraburkholderia caledonica]
MTTIHELIRAYGGTELRQLVVPDQGKISRRIYRDPDIYQMELRKIFTKTWNFICHETQLPNSGDYVTKAI